MDPRKQLNVSKVWCFVNGTTVVDWNLAYIIYVNTDGLYLPNSYTPLERLGNIKSCRLIAKVNYEFKI